MSYLKNISRFAAADNLGGIVDIQVARKADVLSIPEPINGVVTGDITFKPGAGFSRWQVTQESAVIKSESRSSREGSSKGNRLPFMIPKDRAEIRVMLDRAEEDEFIVLFKYPNAKQKLFGLYDSPVRFEYSHDGGQRFSQGNFYSGQFYYDGPDNIFFYLGIITASPPGTGPSTVQHADGGIIATLNPSDELIVSSDFEHSFTHIPGSGPSGTPAIVKWDDGTLIASLQPGDILIVDSDFTFDFEIIGDL